MLNLDLDFIIKLYKELNKIKLEELKLSGIINNLSMYAPDKLKEINLDEKVRDNGKVLKFKELKNIGFKVKRGKNGIR